MKAKRMLYIVLMWLTALIAGMFIGKSQAEKAPAAETEIMETTVDTIAYSAPKAQSETVIGTNLYPLSTIRYYGNSSGGQPRLRHNDSNTVTPYDTVTNHYGTSARGESRCTDTSAIVELPIIQRHYADSTYEAWVSGPIAPRLDSMRVLVRTATIARREWKPPKHWHIGLTAGYGYGPKGFQPYVGIGITYSIISF